MKKIQNTNMPGPNPGALHDVPYFHKCDKTHHGVDSKEN